LKKSKTYYKPNFIIFLIIIILPFKTIEGQNNFSRNDSIQSSAKDTSSIKEHSPKKATIMSAVLPGLGQIYNKKYWKLGIIYGGFGALGYMINQSNKGYKSYRNEYLFRINPDNTGLTENPEYNNFSTENLRTLLDNERRSRDLFVAGSLLLYILNIVDATVDAHLFDFNVNDDLSIRWQPNTYLSYNNKISPGISLKLNF
jgi:hypothetical protein